MSARSIPALVIAGTHSGVGKTSISIGVMAALSRRGLVVQPFKVGPDFIDPAHHAVATGRLSHNLDGWMLNPAANLEVFAAAIDDADACVVEGMMGLFDGVDGTSEEGSTAQIAKLLGLPVVLVVDAWAMARSAGALVKGFCEFDPALNVAGVIFNRVGSPTHLEWLTTAVTSARPVRVVGGIPDDAEALFPERHLGLAMPDHDRTAAWIERMADLVEMHIDLEALTSLSRAAVPGIPSQKPFETPKVRIGIARDEAFCFYYQDNLDLLQRFGAELVEFSPLRDPLPPGLDGLYLGGGYPELFAAELAANSETVAQIREFAAAGRPVYAECGGLIYMSRGIEDASGNRHDLCGVLPIWTQMTPYPTLGYAEVTASADGFFPTGKQARGQRFHYSRIHPDSGDTSLPAPYFASDAGGSPPDPDGLVSGNVVASYIHVHWRSNPEFVEGFVAACAVTGR